MLKGDSTANSPQGAEERVIRAFLERAGPIILESRILEGERFDVVVSMADKMGLSRQQLACELRLLEQRGVIVSAPWDRIDSRGRRPVARDATALSSAEPAPATEQAGSGGKRNARRDRAKPKVADRQSPARLRQGRFRDYALKQIGDPRLLTPRLRRKLEAGAAKMGVIGLMNTLKLETPRYNIKINTVAPNAATKMTSNVFSEDVSKRIKPEFNTPIVTWLCSEENLESGMIFTMSAGWFARSAMVSGKGCCIGDTNRTITAEEIRDRFGQIKDLKSALPYDHCGEIYSLGRPLTGR